MWQIYLKYHQERVKECVNPDKCSFATKQSMFGVLAIVILRYREFPIPHIKPPWYQWPGDVFHPTVVDWEGSTSSQAAVYYWWGDWTDLHKQNVWSRERWQGSLHESNSDWLQWGKTWRSWIQGRFGSSYRHYCHALGEQRRWMLFINIKMIDFKDYCNEKEWKWSLKWIWM